VRYLHKLIRVLVVFSHPSFMNLHLTCISGASAFKLCILYFVLDSRLVISQGSTQFKSALIYLSEGGSCVVVIQDIYVLYRLLDPRSDPYYCYVHSSTFSPHAALLITLFPPSINNCQQSTSESTASCWYLRNSPPTGLRFPPPCLRSRDRQESD